MELCGDDDKPKRLYKCQKVARICTSGYLNYLRHFKMMNCGVYQPKDMVRFGSRSWNKLPEAEKQTFREMSAVEDEKKEAKKAIARMKRLQRREEQKRANAGHDCKLPKATKRVFKEMVTAEEFQTFAAKKETKAKKAVPKSKKLKRLQCKSCAKIAEASKRPKKPRKAKGPTEAEKRLVIQEYLNPIFKRTIRECQQDLNCCTNPMCSWVRMGLPLPQIHRTNQASNPRFLPHPNHHMSPQRTSAALNSMTSRGAISDVVAWLQQLNNRGAADTSAEDLAGDQIPPPKD